MSTYKTRGIVLKRTNFGEADRIITFLTSDQGKLRAVAKGVRKIKSRMAGHLELFGETELMLAKGRNLDVIIGAGIKHHYPNLSQNWESLIFGYLVMEMIDRLTEDGLPQRGLYAITVDLLEELNENGHSATLELAYKLKLLNTLGYRPHLENCVICGQTAENYFFDPKMGAIADNTCARTNSSPMSGEVVQLWRDSLDGHPIGDREKHAQDSLEVCDSFVEQTFGRRFNSRSVMEAGLGT